MRSDDEIRLVLIIQEVDQIQNSNNSKALAALLDQRDALQAAVDRVRHLHRPREADDWTSYKGYCSDEACGVLSPCPTVETLDAALAAVPTEPAGGEQR